MSDAPGQSARATVLAAVRAAVAGAAPAPSAPPAVPGRTRVADLVALFVERVEDYRAVVTRCAVEEVPAAVASALDSAGSVAVPAGFPVDVRGGVPGADLTARELDRLDAVVTTAAVAIAETGTIVLDHGPGQGRRALSLVPDLHVCLVRADPDRGDPGVSGEVARRRRIASAAVAPIAAIRRPDLHGAIDVGRPRRMTRRALRLRGRVARGRRAVAAPARRR